MGRYLRAVLHVPLVFVYEQHVWSPWQPRSFEAEEEEQPGADVAYEPQSKLHLRGSWTFKERVDIATSQ